MRTLKYKSRSTIAFFTAVNQMFGGFRLLPSGDGMVIRQINMAYLTALNQDPVFEVSEESFEDVPIEHPQVSEKTQFVGFRVNRS